jgi:hypothetical protein
VFTGKDSVQNIAMYTKHGYQHEYDDVAGDLTYAYLRRILQHQDPEADDDAAASRGNGAPEGAESRDDG